MGPWISVGLRLLTWGSRDGEAVFQDGVLGGALLLSRLHREDPSPITDPFLSLDPHHHGLRPAEVLDFSYMDVFFSVMWCQSVLCPPIRWQPAGEEHCRFPEWFPSYLDHRLWERPPAQAHLWLRGSWIHTPGLLSLRSKAWTASLYYEIKIVPKDLKGENKIVFSFDCGHNKIAI